MKTQTFAVQYRRKRSGKTDYRRRVRMISGFDTRIVVRRTLGGLLLQVAEYGNTGDKVTHSVRSQDLKKLGWNYDPKNLPSAYLAGYKLGKMIGNKEIIADIGETKSVGGGRIYAALKGLVDAGVALRVSEEVLPPMNRINGSHIAAYAKHLKEKGEKIYQKQFGAAVKRGAIPENIVKAFAETKEKIK